MYNTWMFKIYHAVECFNIGCVILWPHNLVGELCTVSAFLYEVHEIRFEGFNPGGQAPFLSIGGFCSSTSGNVGLVLGVKVLVGWMERSLRKGCKGKLMVPENRQRVWGLANVGTMWRSFLVQCWSVASLHSVFFLCSARFAGFCWVYGESVATSNGFSVFTTTFDH